MPQFFLAVLCILCFLCSEAQAKVGPPKQVSGISFEWSGATVELSLYREPYQMSRTKPIRQFYRATICTSDGKKRELQEEASPISPSLEADVQMIRYGDIRAEFAEGREDAQVRLGKNAHVRLYSPRVDAPITVRARRMSIRLNTERSDGKEYLCATITPRKGKPRTVRTFLWNVGTGIPAQIVSIEPGLKQPGWSLFLTVQVGSLRCILTEDGSFVTCQSPAIPPR